MHETLELVLILLAAAVLVVALFRRLQLPPLLAYLLVGIAIGPHALGWIPETSEAQYLAEFGVVFLMFSVGLEFNLAQFRAMRTIVFGLGGLQVLVTLLIAMGICIALGMDWRAGLAVGSVVAMSSTAIVSRMLAERLELQTRHGRQILGVLLFQDLAVVPFLIMIPALAKGQDGLTMAVAIGMLKAAVVLWIMLVFGQRFVRPWFHLVARQKTTELFTLNVLLVTLGLAYLTGLAGLSMALGAFVAGMLISETEYRYQVEADIQPFRDVLLGLFFVTLGMQLNVTYVYADLGWVVALLLGLTVGKAAVVALLSHRFGGEWSDTLRTALGLAQAGEFGFVLLVQVAGTDLLGVRVTQIVLAAMLLSMLAAPFIIHYSDAIVRRWLGGEWVNRARELHEIAVKSFAVQGHVIVCGYGRSGQNLARLLDQEAIPFIALDLDPARVKLAATAGESVVYGDASRREVLMAAGLSRAKAVVVTYADVSSALRVLNQVQELRPGLAVIVRTLDDNDLDKLLKAGATEVVPEVLEGSLMLASHTLMMMGIPLNRVLRRVREIREQRYGLLKAFFHGATDEEEHAELDKAQPRLYSATIAASSPAIGKTLAELDLESLGVKVTVVRRQNIRGVDPGPDTLLQDEDVVVLLGTPDQLSAALLRLLGE